MRIFRGYTIYVCVCVYMQTRGVCVRKNNDVNGECLIQHYIPVPYEKLAGLLRYYSYLCKRQGYTVYMNSSRENYVHARVEKRDRRAVPAAKRPCLLKSSCQKFITVFLPPGISIGRILAHALVYPRESARMSIPIRNQTSHMPLRINIQTRDSLISQISPRRTKRIRAERAECAR